MRLLVGAGAALVVIAAAPILLVVVLLVAITPSSVNLLAANGPAPIGDLPAPTPYQGADGGCTEPDPTSHGCLTPPTRHALDEIYAAFGPPGPTAPIHSAGCWDRHAWNPRSDHPKGRACDLFPGQAGTFPAGQDLANGWRLATWLRANADPLRVNYLIWQGRFWSPDIPDTDGWGRPYTGGGIYDPADVTGGHFDHIHLSIKLGRE